DARPVPVVAPQAAQAAVQEGCTSLLLDPATPAEEGGPVLLPRSVLWALAQGRDWLPPHEDPALARALERSAQGAGARGQGPAGALRAVGPRAGPRLAAPARGPRAGACPGAHRAGGGRRGAGADRAGGGERRGGPARAAAPRTDRRAGPGRGRRGHRTPRDRGDRRRADQLAEARARLLTGVRRTARPAVRGRRVRESPSRRGRPGQETRPVYFSP